MEYKVVPFTATLDQKKETATVVAEQLGELIEYYNNKGWRYIRLESVSTFVQPDPGCFGFGAKPGYMSSYQMVVFSKENRHENTATADD
jgi:hypothetical protein